MKRSFSLIIQSPFLNNDKSEITMCGVIAGHGT